ncbi:hypothetical protein [Nocardia asiatica]|uniref:hypothetical protein n=1 Tax=Nocardia asiatica TaxID=209252 RepID=UPI002453E5F9|nr:hypothetical protein [Nocardia asiatica]
MTDIVAIHGIWMHRSQRTEMYDRWLDAMVKGLQNIRSDHAASLSLECAFYGHEYNDGKADLEPEYSAVDLESGLETDLVQAIAAAVGSNDEEEGDQENEEDRYEHTKIWLPSAVQKALVTIQRSNLFDGRDAVLVSFVKQVHRYLEDNEFRARVHDEVSAAMAHSPRLVIGHSLGSIVAYDWLQHNEPDDPPAFLTLGSPLGLEAIRRRLHVPVDRSRWPDGARSWTNVAAGHDAVAMVKKLAPLYHPDIDDQPCTNQRRSAHFAVSYLSNTQVSRAIHKALT